MRNLFLRMREECMPLPGNELPVRLRQAGSPVNEEASLAESSRAMPSISPAMRSLAAVVSHVVVILIADKFHDLFARRRECRGEGPFPGARERPRILHGDFDLD